MSELCLEYPAVLISRTFYSFLGKLFTLTSAKVERVLIYTVEYFAVVTSQHIDRIALTLPLGDMVL